MPSQSPPGWVRKVVKRIVKSAAKHARNQPQPSQPADFTGPQTCLRHGGRASANRKNEPITKTVMNVVSFVAKESASSPPMIAGWYVRGAYRKRQMATIRPSVMHAM